MKPEQILDHIPVIIHGLAYNSTQNSEHANIIFCNKTAIESLGYSEKEILTRGFDIYQSVIHPDDLFKTTQTLTILLNSDLDYHYEFYRIKAKNSDTYSHVKGFCKIIRPVLENMPVQFVVTTLKATPDEINEHFPVA